MKISLSDEIGRALEVMAGGIWGAGFTLSVARDNFDMRMFWTVAVIGIFVFAIGILLRNLAQKKKR